MKEYFIVWMTDLSQIKPEIHVSFSQCWSSEHLRQ